MEWKDRGRRRGRRDRSTDEEATGECARAPEKRGLGPRRGARWRSGTRAGGAGSPRSRRSRERATDGAGSRDDDPRRGAGRGWEGGGREGGGADEPESGAPRARTRRVSVSREGGARDATRRSIGGAARDEAGRDAPRAVRELLVGARHVPRGGRPVAHDRHPARGARASRWNAARPERRPTEDQVIGSRRAKGRFAQTEHLSGCSTRERRRPENMISYFAHVRAVPNLESVSSFFHTNTVFAKLVLLAPRRGVPSRGLLAMVVSIAARTLALTFSRSRCFRLFLYVAFIRAPPPHSPSHASGLGLVADSVRSTTGVAPYMNTPSTYVSASSSPGS